MILVCPECGMEVRHWHNQCGCCGISLDSPMGRPVLVNPPLGLLHSIVDKVFAEHSRNA
jgi:predicted amidophosphoribosyltransferase